MEPPPPPCPAPRLRTQPSRSEQTPGTSPDHRWRLPWPTARPRSDRQAHGLPRRPGARWRLQCLQGRGAGPPFAAHSAWGQTVPSPALGGWAAVSCLSGSGCSQTPALSDPWEPLVSCRPPTCPHTWQ